MKNCLKYLVFSFFFAFLFLPSKVEAFSGSGSGIEASPYVITTCSQLQEMQDDLDGYYVLGNDIDCTESSGWSWDYGTGFKPVGGYWESGTAPGGVDSDFEMPMPAGPTYTFSGSLNGNDYTISNLFISSTYPYSGLFGATNNAYISNLKLNNPVVKGVAYTPTSSLISLAKDTQIDNVEITLDLRGANVQDDLAGYGAFIGSSVGNTRISNSQVSGYIGESSSAGNSVGGFVGKVITGWLTISNSIADFVGDFSSGMGIGCFVGRIDTSMDSVSISINSSQSLCDISISDGYYAGGFVGYSDGSNLGDINISNSEFKGNFVTVDSYGIGGFVGMNSNDNMGISITGSDFTGTLMNTTNSVGAWGFGGFIGYNSSSHDFSISNSESSGDISIIASDYDAYGIGGFVGGIDTAVFNGLNLVSSNSINLSENESGDFYDIGNIVGFTHGAVDFEGINVDLDIQTSNISTLYYVGGLIGQSGGGGSLFDTFVSGDISILGYDDVLVYDIGGVVGMSYLESLSISNAYYSGEIILETLNSSNPAYLIGGIVGDQSLGSIENSYANLTLILDEPLSAYSFRIGGIAGVSGGLIRNSAAKLTVSANGYLGLIGGLVGNGSVIENSFAEVNLTAGDDSMTTGGLAFSADSISNSYAYGLISYGDDAHDIGGLIGFLDDTVILNSYSNTAISLGSTPQDVGGLVGNISDTDTLSSVTNSYWNLTTSGIATSLFGTGYTDVQMKVEGNFSGWDFSTLWNIDSSVNGGYPYFANSLSTFSLSQNGSATYAQSYDTDITFGGTWPMSLVRYQWSTSTTPNPSNWTEITSYTDIQTPTDTTGAIYLHVDYDNLLGFGDTVVSGAFLLDNTNPTIAYSQNTDTVTVNVSDSDSGIAVFQYFWSQSQSVPSSGWISGAEGSSIDKPTESGTWYLHTKSIDNAGNLVLGVSDAVVVSASTTPVTNTPNTTEVEETDVVEEEEINDLDEEEIVDTNEDENVDEIDENNSTGDSLDTIVDSKEDKKTLAEVTGEILSIFTEEPVIKTSILATGVASSVLILTPSFWLNLSIGIWERLLGLFGLFVRKKEKRSGVVYDSVTKEPVKLAIVRFFDKEGKLITSEVTDAMGAYYLDYEGEYRMEVSANRYNFPSKIISGKDSTYSNIYTGGYITEKEASIPLDMKENGIVRAMFVFLSNKVGLMWNVLCWILFIFGLSLVMYDLTIEITNVSLILLGVYVFLLLASFISLKKKYGSVISAYGDVLSGYRVRLMNKELESISYERITNEEGEYKFVVPEGEYQLQVLNTNGDIVFNKDIFDIKSKDGLISIIEDIVI